MAKPLVMGRKEIARVYRIAETAVSDRWVPGGVISYEDAAIVSGKAYWPGGLVVELALPPGSRGRQLDVGLLEELEWEQGATVRPMKAGSFLRWWGCRSTRHCSAWTRSRHRRR